MLRSFYYKDYFIFNSEDRIQHHWGDFVLLTSTSKGPFNFVIDEVPISITLEEIYCFIAFHRDKDGMIDHLLPCNTKDEILQKCNENCYPLPPAFPT